MVFTVCKPFLRAGYNPGKLTPPVVTGSLALGIPQEFILLHLIRPSMAVMVPSPLYIGPFADETKLSCPHTDLPSVVQ